MILLIFCYRLKFRIMVRFVSRFMLSSIIITPIFQLEQNCSSHNNLCFTDFILIHSARSFTSLKLTYALWQLVLPKRFENARQSVMIVAISDQYNRRFSSSYISPNINFRLCRNWVTPWIRNDLPSIINRIILCLRLPKRRTKNEPRLAGPSCYGRR